MSRDGHTLSCKAKGVLATEHLSLGKEKKKATPQANISVSVSNYLAVFSPVCKKEASYATCFVPGFWGAFYAFITELTAKKWLEMRGFRDCGGHNEGSQQDSNHGCCSSWLAP